MRVSDLVKEVKDLLARGVWQPHVLFLELNRRYRRLHYSTINKAIHIAKTEIYK